MKLIISSAVLLEIDLVIHYSSQEALLPLTLLGLLYHEIYMIVLIAKCLQAASWGKPGLCICKNKGADQLRS